jgi:IS30 family transposase
MNSNNKARQKTGRKPLTLRERIDIENKYQYGMGINKIARELNRNKSTISRELSGKAREGINKYRADIAHRKACARIEKRGSTPILDTNRGLYKYVTRKLKLGWSPEQVSGRLRKDFKENKAMRISHEAIYQYVYSENRISSTGKMRKGCIDLRPLLPRGRKRRAAKGFRRAQKLDRRAQVPSIDTRPDIVESRARVGDWEDDFLVSRSSKVCIKSTNERKTGVVFFGKTLDGTAKSGDAVLVEKLSKIPSEYVKTLTRDNGSENKNWRFVQAELDLDVYFAHPYHSWERGSNENTNGLLRRYFPKGTDWGKITNEEIARAEYLINTRPRKRLGWLTPAEVFYQETGVALFV